MLSFQTFTRRAPALAFAATLLASALGLPSSVSMAAPPEEPEARLQLVVHEVKILDNHEGLFSGIGEMELHVDIWRCDNGVPVPCLSQQDSEKGSHGIMSRGLHKFKADDGDTLTLDRVFPGEGDSTYGGNTSASIGFPIFPGKPTVMRIYMAESDRNITVFNDDDYLGSIYRYFDTGENGLGLGTYSVQGDMHPGKHDGDFTISYDIRMTPLPDLRPGGIKVSDLPGSAKKRVCVGYLNSEIGASGPFEVVLRVDGAPLPGPRPTVAGLASGGSGEQCFETTQLNSGQHQLAAMLDEPRLIKEFNETNNVLEQTYTAPQTLTQLQAELSVSEIRVQGQVPDGKDDCKDGKNDLTVLVKNAGPGNAGAFVVRLVVDGAQDATEETSVSGLTAGQEQEVRFLDVRLKKGARTLTATVDSTSSVAESTEDNNDREVTAQCKGAS